MNTLVVWVQKNKKAAITIGVVILIVSINLFLFRGNTNYGMEYDEVYRLNNLFPMLNNDVYPYNQSIYSLIIGGVRYPIMYKEYISTASLLPGVLVFLFGSNLLALRYSYIAYTAGLEILVYFFFKKKNLFVAVLSACFIAVCPMLFPFIRYGWATVMYGYFLIIGFNFLKHYKKTGKRIYLFLGVFSFALLINVLFYSLWIVGGALFTVILFYPAKSLSFIKSIKNILVSLCGIVLGLFHFVAYNVAKGFPSLMTLINYLFRLDKYNANAIDGRKTSSLFASFGSKIRSYIACIEPLSQIYLYLLLALLLIYILYLIKVIRKGTFQKKKKYFTPLIATVVSFAFMLVSPNSENSHHLTYIVIYLCITVSVGLWLLSTKLGINKKCVSVIAIIVLSFNLYQCGISVNKDIESNGNGYFTEKIFDLVDYVRDDPYINDTNTLFVEWGFSSQFYFLNKGKYKTRDITFAIISKTNDERNLYFESFFPTLDDSVLYVPAYYSDGSGTEYTYREITDGDVHAFHEPIQAFVNFVRNNNGIVTIREWFPDDDGKDIVLLKIENIDGIKDNLDKFEEIDYENVTVSSFHKQDNYEYLSGFYAYEANNDLRWVKKQSRIVLLYDNQQYLRIQYWVPLLGQRDHETIVDVKINNKTVYSENVKSTGFRTIQLEMSEILDDIPPCAVEITFCISSQVINTSDSRQLGCCIDYIEFVDDE